MLPNFLIIGAPRAGTTWISKNISLHPDIYMPKLKEIHYFDRHYDEGIGYYEEYFTGYGNEKMIGEATPAYLFTQKVPELIKKDLGNIKLIVSLRNPVERLYSRYWNAKGKYIENKDLSFEEKIKAKPLFIEEGFYYDHLMRYLASFPPENILFLLFDDIKKDSKTFLASIYDFLDVDTEFTSPLIDKKINTSSSKKMLAKSRNLWYLQKMVEKLGVAKLMEWLKTINEPKIPTMNPKTKRWLVDEVYRGRNYQLEQLIGRDLNHWNKI